MGSWHTSCSWHCLDDHASSRRCWCVEEEKACGGDFRIFFDGIVGSMGVMTFITAQASIICWQCGYHVSHRKMLYEELVIANLACGPADMHVQSCTEVG